jgi:hypothetical protein
MLILLLKIVATWFGLSLVFALAFGRLMRAIGEDY